MKRLARLMVVVGVVGAVVGFGVAAFGQVGAPDPSTAGVGTWVELFSQAPLAGLAVWLGYELRAAHREGMQTIGEAIDRIGEETRLNREAIDRLATNNRREG